MLDDRLFCSRIIHRGVKRWNRSDEWERRDLSGSADKLAPFFLTFFHGWSSTVCRAVL